MTDPRASVVHIQGLPVLSFPGVAAAARWILDEPADRGVAVALNAEKLVTVRRDPEVLAPLKTKAFFYADGMPVRWLLRRHGVSSARVPGVELWEELMRNAGDRRVYLLGASEEVNRATAEKLEAEFGLRNLKRRNGYFDDPDAVIREIQKFSPDIVSVALGSPKQEAFMARAHDACPNTFFMGVGGSYDVFVGRVARAPKWMQSIGLEWAYRTIRQPQRILRNVSYLEFMYLYLARKI